LSTVQYLTDPLQHHRPTRSMCSSATLLLSVPRQNLNSSSRAIGVFWPAKNVELQVTQLLLVVTSRLAAFSLLLPPSRALVLTGSCALYKTFTYSFSYLCVTCHIARTHSVTLINVGSKCITTLPAQLRSTWKPCRCLRLPPPTMTCYN